MKYSKPPLGRQTIFCKKRRIIGQIFPERTITSRFCSNFFKETICLFLPGDGMAMGFYAHNVAYLSILSHLLIIQAVPGRPGGCIMMSGTKLSRLGVLVHGKICHPFFVFYCL
jgi:hypothetical protein